LIKILLMIWIAVSLFMLYIFCAAARRYVSEDPGQKADDHERTPPLGTAANPSPTAKREKDCRKGHSRRVVKNTPMTNFSARQRIL